MHLRQDLAASGLFASVDYQEWPDLADSYQNYDLIITGRYYVHTRQTDVFPLMGLLLLQPLLGLPTGAIDRNMAFEVQVLDPQHPGQPLWAQRFKVHDDASGIKGLYYGLDPRVTPKLRNKGFREVREALAKAFGPGGPLDGRFATSQARR